MKSIKMQERINIWSFFILFKMLQKICPTCDIEKTHWFWNPVLFVPFILVFGVFNFTQTKEGEIPYMKIGEVI